MSYLNTWNDRVENLVSMDWFSTRTLNQTMREVRGIDFSVRTQREAAREMLTKMVPFENIFDQRIRFPVQGTYVCSVLGDWPKKLTQILEALNYKDESKDIKDNSNREATVGLGKGNDRNTTSAPSKFDYNDALHAFWTGTQAVLDQIGSMSEVYSQRKFEATFNLRWYPKGNVGRIDASGRETPVKEGRFEEFEDDLESKFRDFLGRGKDKAEEAAEEPPKRAGARGDHALV